MKVSLAYLERCSAQTGYTVSPLEKVVRLGDFAGDITRHPYLSHVLALKGGTALNLCFGQPRRLSVDLDFNYTGHGDREEMLAERPRVEQAVRELAKRKGYRVQQSADAFAGRKIYLIYRSVLGPEDRIELDINYLFRVPIAGVAHSELWQPGELDRPQARTVSLQEIVVGKMLAMLDRGAARDVWDLANLPQPAKDVMLLPSFRPWFIALSAVLNHPLPTYTQERLEGLLSDRAVAEQLAPLLAVDAPPRAQDLIREAWAVISDFTTLRPNEADYIASIECGELRPELLFADDEETAQRVARHPAILWKVSNVRIHLAQRRKKHNR